MMPPPLALVSGHGYELGLGLPEVMLKKKYICLFVFQIYIELLSMVTSENMFKYIGPI